MLKEKILERISEKYGENKVIAISTVGKEKTKSSLLSVARGLEIDHKIVQKITDLIPNDRGQDWSLKDCVFGNESKDRKPVDIIVKYYKQYKQLFELAFEVDGLVNRRSSHASGIIIYPKDIVNYNSIMYTPKGQKITAWTMEDSQYAGGIKFDFLYTEYQAKLQTCLEIMAEYGVIPQGHIIDNYYKYLTPKAIDLTNPDMWRTIFHEGRTSSIFQFETKVGREISKQVKPNNVFEMATANSLMRLKSDLNVGHISNQLSEKYGFEFTAEQIEILKHIFESQTLTSRFIEYKNNEELPKQQLEQLGCSIKFIEQVYKTLGDTYTVCVTQEDLMMLSMDFAGFDIAKAHGLRKSIAKKSEKLLSQNEELIVQGMKEKLHSDVETLYVWLQIMGLAGYGFSSLHSIGYSLIGLQGAYLAYKYPIYWHTANLMVNGKAVEQEDESVSNSKSADWGKLTLNLTNIINEGYEIRKPHVNTSSYSFVPNEKDNVIEYALKSVNSISDTHVEQILSFRPYTSFKDFLQRCVIDNPENKINKNVVLNLLFSNAFEGFPESKKEIVEIFF